MSKFNSPIPVQTKIVDNLDLNTPWKKWFKDIGDDWVSANQVKGRDNFKYVVNGITCVWTFTGTSETIILPFTVGVDSVFNGQIITKGTTEIDLNGPSSGFYYIQF